MWKKLLILFAGQLLQDLLAQLPALLEKTLAKKNVNPDQKALITDVLTAVFEELKLSLNNKA